MIALDSSFLIGYYNERDSQHAAARDLMDDFLGGKWGPGLLLEYVLLEVVTVLLMRRNLEVASRVGRLLLTARELEFVPCSDVFLQALQTFEGQAGTRLSFTDAALAVIARTRAEGRILTFDAEFAKFPGLHPQPE